MKGILKREKRNVRKILGTIVLISFIAPIGFLVYKIATTSNEVTEVSVVGRVKSDYILMLLECVLGILAMTLPSMVTRKFSLEVPDKIYYLYVVFLYSAIYLGEVRDFYYVVPSWDTILHSMSGLMLGFLGFSLVDILNTSNKRVQLSPFFVAIFAFAFAITVGVIWEVYEFSADSIFGTNMQKYKLQDGTELIGREAVKDTMEDLIVDAISAFIASAIGYISLKYKKGWLNDLRIRFKKNRSEEKTPENS